MMDFLVVWGFCTLTMGAFCGMIVVCSINCRYVVVKTLAGILTAALVGLAVGGMLTTSEKIDEARWNNGQCEECGGEWRLNGVTTTRMGSKTYYWSCLDCGNVIETSTRFK